jgi:hypothetical protein
LFLCDLGVGHEIPSSSEAGSSVAERVTTSRILALRHSRVGERGDEVRPSGLMGYFRPPATFTLESLVDLDVTMESGTVNLLPAGAVEGLGASGPLGEVDAEIELILEGSMEKWISRTPSRAAWFFQFTISTWEDSVTPPSGDFLFRFVATDPYRFSVCPKKGMQSRHPAGELPPGGTDSAGRQLR